MQCGFFHRATFSLHNRVTASLPWLKWSQFAAEQAETRMEFASTSSYGRYLPKLQSSITATDSSLSGSGSDTSTVLD